MTGTHLEDAGQELRRGYERVVGALVNPYRRRAGRNGAAGAVGAAMFYAVADGAEVKATTGAVCFRICTTTFAVFDLLCLVDGIGRAVCAGLGATRRATLTVASRHVLAGDVLVVAEPCSTWLDQTGR